jgi:uncharacterized membrane protein YphA (DoxX/SURF4 family)
MLVNTDVGLAVLHIATGVFFTISGYRKSFVPMVHERVTLLFKKKNVAFAEWPVPLGEFFGGLGLLFGVLTQAAAAGLILIMLGAFFLDTWEVVKAKRPANLLDWIAKCLCTPEGQLLVVLTTIVFTGAGAYSGDALIKSWL